MLKKPVLVASLGLLFLHTLAAPAFATVNSLTITPPTQDSYIREDNTTRNYGAATTLRIQSRSGNKDRRSLLSFDLSSVPTGATLEAAELRLYVTRLPKNQRTINVHRLTNSWLEGSGNGVNNSPAINGVTWWERQYGNNAWTGAGPWDWVTRGGDFQAAVTAATLTPAANGWMSWNVLTDVSAWYGGAANYGWMLKDAAEDSGSRQRMKFVSKEDGGQPLFWPQLLVTYLLANTTGPTEMFVGELTNTTVSFMNSPDFATDQISSATLTVPAGFSDIPTSGLSYTITASGGKNWQMVAGPTGPLGPQTFTVAAATPADELAAGEQVDVTFSVRPPWTAGNTAWPSTVQGAAGGTFAPPDLNIMVTAGTLNMVTGGDQALSDVVLNGLDQTAVGTLGTLTTRDGRGTAEGWQVMVSATDFVNTLDAAKTIPASGFNIPAPPTVTTVAGSNPPVSGSGNLSGTGVQLLLASVGNGMGEFQVTPDIDLVVPAETFAGSYIATVTETISSLP